MNCSKLVLFLKLKIFMSITTLIKRKRYVRTNTLMLAKEKM